MNKKIDLSAQTQKLRAASRQRIERARKHVLMLPIMSALGLLVIAISIFAALRLTGGASVLQPERSATVEITYDKQKRILPTTAKTVDELLQKLDISLKNGDVVEPAKSTQIAGDKFRINVYRAMPVVVLDGDKATYAVSAATTPRSIAKQIGLEVYAEDRLTTSLPGDFVTNYSLGEEIAIERSMPVNMNLYGTHTPMRTLAKTVGDLLKEKKISLAGNNSVHPTADTALTPNTQVFVLAEGVSIEVQEEQIAMPVETVQDASLSFGVTAIRQAGQAGKRLVTYQIDRNTGAKTKIQEIVAQEAITQIMVRGTFSSIPSDKQGVMAAAGLSPEDFMYADYIISRESGWNAGASNKSSGAYGLCQALPGTKMTSAGSDWQTNPVTQVKWCNGYAVGRYGSWQNAYNTWLSKHWW